MVDAVYTLLFATWFFLILQKRVKETGDWHEVVSRVVQAGMFVFLVYKSKEIVTALVYVMTNTWCAIVYPFTQVCKG